MVQGSWDNVCSVEVDSTETTIEGVSQSGQVTELLLDHLPNLV